MDPHLERRVNLSRRHFLGRAGVSGGRGAGGLLQSDLLAQTPAPSATRRAAGPPALRAESQTGDLSVSGRRAVADRLVRLQAAAGEMAGDRPARFDPERAAVDGDDFGPDELSGCAIDLSVRATWAIGGVGQRADAAHRQGGGQPVFHQVDAHRTDQSRPGGHVRADGLSDCGAAEPGRVGDVRARDDEPGPAGVCRDDHGERPIAGGAAVGDRVHSEPVSGDQAAVGGRPGAVCVGPGGLRQVATGAVHRGSGETEPAGIRDGEQSGDQHAHRAV